MKFWPAIFAAKKHAPGTVAPPDLADPGSAGSAWEDQLTRSMLPAGVEGILGSAATGDLCAQVQLFNSMLDTWAGMANNDRALGDAVVGAPWEVRPAAPDGEASPAAEARAALVRDALHGMKPDPAKTSECGRDGLLRHLVRGNMLGHQVLEILWERREWNGGTAILPRAVRRAGSQFYGYRGASRDLQFREGGNYKAWPDNKFLIHVVSAHDAHPASAGRWRALAKYWGASCYGFEWLMLYVNKFGAPFRWATYKSGFTAAQRAQLLAMLGNLGTAGYGAFPEGTRLELLEASKSGGDLPHSLVLKLADQACDLIYKGEVATGGVDKPTGFSSGAEQGSVRREALQGHCNTVCTTLNQLVRHVLLLNYGDTTDAPEIVCELPEPADAKVNAERDEILVRAGVPVTLAQLQTRHDLDAPAEGETVLLGGRLTQWSDAAIAPATPAAPPAKLTAAKAAALPDMSTEAVLERLLNAAVIAGAEDYQRDAAAAEDEDEPEA